MSDQEKERRENSGHGHVYPRPDGVRARCGGPGLCVECSRDKVRKDRAEAAAVAEPMAQEPKAWLNEHGDGHVTTDPDIAECWVDLGRKVTPLYPPAAVADEMMAALLLAGSNLACHVRLNADTDLEREMVDDWVRARAAIDRAAMKAREQR